MNNPFNKKIKFCEPHIGLAEQWAVNKVLRSGTLTNGEVTKQLEKEFAEFVGAEYAVAVSSATVGLELCLRYLGIGEGDLVIVPSYTFCATAQAVITVGGDVIFGDVEPKTLCLDPNSFIVKNSMKMAKAVIPVHLAGNKAFTDYSLPVIEDSAHRIERDQCKDNPNSVVFSFYATKNMTTGEGGMIATNDPLMYKWLLKARLHGINKIKRYEYSVEFNGWKANMTEIQAAIGLVQVRKLDKMNAMRDRVVQWYNEYLPYDHTGNHLYAYFVNNRDEFIEYMEKNGVQCSTHFRSLHKMPAFKKHNKFKLEVTEEFSNREVSLPMYPHLKKRQVKRICRLIKNWEDNISHNMYKR